MKTCSKCGETKLFKMFGKRAALKDGHSSHCNSCRAIVRRARRAADPKRFRNQEQAYRDNNREQWNATHAAWIEANRDHRRKQQHIWYEANRELSIERNLLWRTENPEQKRATHRAWHAKNPEANSRYLARRKALKLGVTLIPFTVAELRASYIAWHLTDCVYCGGPYEHDDHVVPLSRGGTHSLANLVPACTHCNCTKSSKLISEWMPDHWLAQDLTSFPSGTFR